MADFTVEQLEQMEQSIDRERKGIIATADFVEPEELHRRLSIKRTAASRPPVSSKEITPQVLPSFMYF